MLLLPLEYVYLINHSMVVCFWQRFTSYLFTKFDFFEDEIYLYPTFDK